MADQVLQRVAVDAAVQIARGAPDHTALLEALVHQLGADSGACLVTWSLTGSAFMDSIQVAGCPPMTQQLSEQDLQHPGIARFPQCATVRLSDVINLKRFWGTPQYQRVHGWLEGYNYPLGAQLYSSRNRLVLLALHRSQRDFTDCQVEQLEAVRRPLSAALTFRAELSRAAAGLQLPSASYVPTQREKEVLALMARGWGDARIGHHLGITERTVRKHLGHVYERAGVSGRAAAAAWWAGVPQR